MSKVEEEVKEVLNDMEQVVEEVEEMNQALSG